MCLQQLSRLQSNKKGNVVPCQDLFGSSCLSEGGICCRIGAGYTSMEAQKSTGSSQAHSLFIVYCLHQHTSLRDISSLVRVDKQETVKAYFQYKEDVSREVYHIAGEAFEDN